MKGHKGHLLFHLFKQRLVDTFEMMLAHAFRTEFIFVDAARLQSSESGLPSSGYVQDLQSSHLHARWSDYICFAHNVCLLHIPIIS